MSHSVNGSKTCNPMDTALFTCFPKIFDLNNIVLNCTTLTVS